MWRISFTQDKVWGYASGYVPDSSDTRRHHEIYLSDPRKADLAKLKTVIRHPIRTI